MVFRGLIKNQKGFTLIELLVVLAITGLISTGITMTTFQVLNINVLTSNRVVAITEVENAGYWISRDAKMAQSIVTDDDTLTPEIERLTLAWVGWEYESAGNTYVNTYKIRYTHAGSELWRHQEVTTYDSSGHLVETATSQMLVAKHTAIAPSTGNKLTITAKVGDAEEARTYEITPRVY